MKRFIIAALALLLTSCLAMPSSARDFVPVGVDPLVEDKIAFTVEDLRNGPGYVSLLMKPKAPEDGDHGLWCLSFTTENCKLERGYTVQAHAIIPACTNDEGHCIESFYLESSSSGRVRAEQITDFATGFSFPALEQLKTPVGAGPSLWRVPGVFHAGGTDLYVVAVNSSFSVTDGLVVRYGALSAAIYPVVELSGPRYRPSAVEQVTLNGQTIWVHDNGEQGSNDGCVLTTIGKCWARDEFASGVRAELNVRASSEIAGWLHGRLASPSISIKPIDATQNLFTVNAEPVEVPIMYAETQYSSLTTDEKELFENWFAGGGFANGKQWLKYPSYENRARVLISKFGEAAGNRAAAIKSSWQFNSISNNQQQAACYANQKGLVGLVTTNAMAYDQAAPEFKNGSLNYSVAGLHLLPDGSKAIGKYDLLIRSDVARCLYGFTNAPVSAKISVLTAEGENIVASTLVSEVDGWLKLAAYGFTFSEKNISVRIIQPQSAILEKFKPSQKKLSTWQMVQADSFARRTVGANKITCNATYFGSKVRSAALTQAKAVCDRIKLLSPETATEIKVSSVKKASDALRVYLKSS